MVTERCRRLRLPHLTHRTRSVVRPRIASRLKGEIATIGVVIAFANGAAAAGGRSILYISRGAQQLWSPGCAVTKPTSDCGSTRTLILAIH